MSSPSPSPPLNTLTATAARASGTSITDLARAHLTRYAQRDAQVRAWAYLDEKRVLAEAARLDALPREQRGRLWGVVVGVKDMIQTKDMPTAHGSPLYVSHEPGVDAGVVAVLRAEGALIIGKTHTTEFAFTTVGPPTTNPHDARRTPGGSSSGSAAAVADWQCQVAVGTQTIGSIIRPASFNGIFGYKPTWGSITREGAKISSLTLDTVGFFARCTADLELLAAAFRIVDDDADDSATLTKHTPKPLSECRFGFVKTDQWASFPAPAPSPELAHAWEESIALLRQAGATVQELDLPEEFNGISRGVNMVVNGAEVGINLLPEHIIASAPAPGPSGPSPTSLADKLHPSISDLVLNSSHATRRAYTSALDRLAQLRPRMDDIARGYDALITPSAPGQAPLGLGFTGDSRFCGMWTALHLPCVNVPGFASDEGMPLGLTLVAPRFHDVRLLGVAGQVAEVWAGADAGRLNALPA